MSLCQTPDPQEEQHLLLRVFVYSLWFVAGFTLGGAGWLFYNAPPVFDPPAPISPYVARAG